jgi:hypothetical protein
MIKIDSSDQEEQGNRRGRRLKHAEIWEDMIKIDSYCRVPTKNSRQIDVEES